MAFRRMQDAIKAGWSTLWGRSETQQQMREVRQEWGDQLMQIDSMFEKMNALAARLAKRQARAEAPDEPIALPEAPVEHNQRAMKVDIRRRIRSRQGRMLAVPENSTGDE